MNTNKPPAQGDSSSDSAATDAFLRYLKSPQYQARNDFVSDATDLPDLGIFKLSLTQAADLVAVDMYGSGYIDVDVLTHGGDEGSEPEDPRNTAALAPHRARLVERMIDAILAGTLKTARTMRGLFTGEVDPDATFLDYYDLVDWLEGYGYAPSDWMAEYTDEESTILEDLVESLFDIRNIRARPSSDGMGSLAMRHHVLTDAGVEETPEFAEMNAKRLRSIAKGFAAECALLRGELERRPIVADEPTLHPKGRNTLYRLIVALCIAAGVNPAERGAAVIVARLSQQAGLPVGDDTIRKILGELPEIGSG